MSDRATFELRLQSLMRQSAPIIAQSASNLCVGSLVDAGDCAWYHGSWQFLRLIDLVSSPTWHRDFYLDGLEKYLSERPYSRIAITGAADYSMLAHVENAIRTIRATAETTVIDVCPTALFACQWYADRSAFRVTCLRSDVRKLQTSDQEKLDIICTDAFLTRFSSNHAAEVLVAWNEMLRLGGVVLTTVRITPAEDDGERAQLADRFVERALERWAALDNPPSVDLDDIAARARRYATNIVSHATRSKQEVITSIRRYFNIEHIETVRVNGEFYPTEYVRVIMSKGVPQ